MRRRYHNHRLSQLAWLLGLLIIAPCLFAQGGRELKAERTEASDKRTALVIGNATYATARKLANPVNDANDMAGVLRDLGFDVISGTDLSLKDMNDKVREFGDRLKRNGGVGLFYYAGHGIQVGGRNYLIPVDANIPREDEIEFNALNLDLVLRKLDSANNGLNIIILDACRNNPFARSWSRGDDGGGLAQISAPTGTFIAYATSPNRTASDGDGRNGLYTSQMLRVLKRPNLKIEETFKEIRKAVDTASGGNQVPWDSSSLRGEFYFAGAVGTKPAASVIPPRVETSTATVAKLPTADDVLTSFARAIGSEQAKKINTLVLIGIMENEINGEMIKTDIEVYSKQPDKFLRLIKYPSGEITGEVFNGNRGWKASTGKPIVEVPVSEVEANHRSSALGMADIAAMKRLYPSITVTGKQKFGDTELTVVTLKTRDGKTEKMYFDPATGLLDRWQFTEDDTTRPGIVYTVDCELFDYQLVNGVRMPMTLRQKASGITITVKFNILQTKFNVPLADSLFSGN